MVTLKNMSNLCRICVTTTDEPAVEKIFDRRHRRLLQQIQELTGLLLRKSKDLPQQICKQCQVELVQAHVFRERCIASQKYFNTKYCKEKSKLITEKDPNLEPGCGERYEGEEQEVAIECEALRESKIGIFIKVEQTAVQEEEYFEDVTDIGDQMQEHHESQDSGEKTDIEKEQISNKNIKQLEKFKIKTSSNQVCTKKSKSKEKSNNYICDQCGNHFKGRYRFMTHQIRHTGVKPYQCEVCPDKFFTQSELNRHMRRHTGERPFGCKYCSRSFSDYSTRIKHERTHTNERPFSCVHCSKSFTTSYILKNHLLIHSGERPFTCALCHKSFQLQSHLMVHYRSIIHKQNEEQQRKLKLEENTIIPTQCDQMTSL